MGKPSAPQPTNPAVAIGAQTQSNADTARLQSQLNNVNQYGPYGSVTYQKNGDQWSQYVQPNDDVLHQIDATVDAQNQALGTATRQIGRVDQALQTPLSLNGLPNLESEAVEPGLYGYDAQTAPQISGSFNQGQPVQGQVGPTDFTADRNAVTDSVINQARSRLDPYYQTQEDHLRTRLANQGISQNDAAYANATDEFNRGKNDAYNQATYSGIQQGAAEQQQLFGQRVAQGQFANQAAGQEFGQGMTAQDFANQAGQQGYENQRSSVQDADAVRQQMFANQVTNLNATNLARGQALQERAYVQNQPIDQLATLLGLGSQVQLPQGAPQGNTGVAPTDVVGAYANYDRNQQVAYQNKMSVLNGLLGGLGQVGSAAITASDRRLKRDIVPLWKRDGLMWYAYRYLWSPVIRFGVMAQEVARTRPEAVVRVGPWLAVDYRAL